jgi:large subunit ribosomal protein L21
MYAVIETGGKQYRVEVGTELEVELLDVEPGQAITLERVLLVADGDDAAIGRPIVADAAVEAEVLGRERGDKVISFKYKPKARRRVKKGHRQELIRLRVTDVRFNGKSAAEATRASDEAARKEREEIEAAAKRQAAEDAALAAKLELGSTPAATKRGKAAKADEAAETEPQAEAAETAPKRSRAKGAAKAEAKAATDEAAETEPQAEPAEAEAETAETTDEAPGAAEAADAPTPRKRASRTKKDD